MEIQPNIQYIFDAKGNKTAAIVPISLWESMIKIEKNTQDQLKKKNPDSLFGILKGSSTLDEIEEYSKKVRREAIERT